MTQIKREIKPLIKEQLLRGKSILLLGPRQVGKTTLAKEFFPDLHFSLMQNELRQRYERSPETLRFEILAEAKLSKKLLLVFIDEIQLVPKLMNEIQDLIDNKVAQFILSGSSARKLKHQNHINLLPGRVILFYLEPCSDFEMQDLSYTLEDRLYFGSLPEIILETKQQFRDQTLKTYVETYLEEEVRREALVRNVAQFGRFLELAAAQSGEIINLTKLSQEIGVAHTTIRSYYEILEDCLIAKRIDPFTQTKTRRRLVQSSKYLIFDLGVRRLAAREGYPASQNQIGSLFEQWIGLELLRWAEQQHSRPQIFFWRDHSGTEVDFVLKRNNELIPIEVKWTKHPTAQDINHLKIFMKEYGCKVGFLICRTPKPMALDENITALPWNRRNIFLG